MSIFDSPEFDSILAGIVYDSRVQSPDCDIMTDEEYDEAMKDHLRPIPTIISEDEEDEDEDWDDDEEYEDEGQPTHYEECQDLYGGDDYIEQWEVE